MSNYIMMNTKPSFVAVSKEHFIFIPLYNSLSGEIKNFRDGLSKVSINQS